jgi:hypothetical protein
MHNNHFYLILNFIQSFSHLMLKDYKYPLIISFISSLNLLSLNNITTSPSSHFLLYIHHSTNVIFLSIIISSLFRLPLISPINILNSIHFSTTFYKIIINKIILILESTPLIIYSHSLSISMIYTQSHYNQKILILILTIYFNFIKTQ